MVRVDRMRIYVAGRNWRYLKLQSVMKVGPKLLQGY